MRGLDVAQELVTLTQRMHGQAPAPLALIKLAYFAHGWHLAMADVPLLDETIEAWPTGPIVPSIYHAVRHWRSSPVLNVCGARPAQINPVTQKILNDTVRAYGAFDPVALSSLAHASGTPWAVVRDLSPDRNAPISNAHLTDHFRRLLFDARPDTSTASASSASSGQVVSFPRAPRPEPIPS